MLTEDLVAAFLLLASCGGPRTTAAPTSNRAESGKPTDVRMVTSDGRTIRFLRYDGHSLVVTKTITAPARIGQLDWVGTDPVVRLAANDDDRPWEQNAPPDPALDGQIGRVSEARGYEPFSAIVDAAWQITPPTPHAERTDTQWDLRSTKTGEIWQGRCDYGFLADGDVLCDHWTYARLAPGPTTFTQDPPDGGTPQFPLVDAPAPVAPKIDIREENVPDPYDSSATRAITILHCTPARGVAVDVPPASEDRAGFIGMQELHWIVTEPPVFHVHRIDDGFAGVDTPMTFEGCRYSERLGDDITPGPDGLVAIHGGQQLTLAWRGTLLGSVNESASEVRFAPGR